MKAYLFKKSAGSFISALNDADIQYSMDMQRSFEPQNSGNPLEIIEAISDAMPWKSLAKVIEKWIDEKKSREVIITLEENKVFHAKGYSADEVRVMLGHAKNIMVIDTESNGET